MDPIDNESPMDNEHGDSVEPDLGVPDTDIKGLACSGVVDQPQMAVAEPGDDQPDAAEAAVVAARRWGKYLLRESRPSRSPGLTLTAQPKQMERSLRSLAGRYRSYLMQARPLTDHCQKEPGAKTEEPVKKLYCNALPKARRFPCTFSGLYCEGS